MSNNGNGIVEIKVADVIYDEELYPRAAGFDQETVGRYRLALDKLPPIEITHENILVDGYHRLIAHRIEQRDTIPAIVEEMPRESVLWESVRRNAIHGFQLSQGDKKRLGPIFYQQGRGLDDIADVLSVDKSAVYRWTTDIRQNEKEERNEKIWQMWLACHTQEMIADAFGLAQKTVSNIVDDSKNSYLQKNTTPDSLQLFTVWNFQNNDPRFGMDYPGRIPGQIIENTIYYYTEPFDTVIDPFGGGGTTIDVCKATSRRYRVYDLKPVRDDIRQNDITQGFPAECKGANLIFLDPPYWSQKKGDYSADDTNLANLPLDEFYQQLDGLFQSASETMTTGGYIALIIGPTQTKSVIYDHAFEIAKLLEKRFEFVNRIIVPYTTQQAKGYHVSDAKENRYLLKLHRDLLVYRKP